MTRENIIEVITNIGFVINEECDTEDYGFFFNLYEDVDDEDDVAYKLCVRNTLIHLVKKHVGVRYSKKDYLVNFKTGVTIKKDLSSDEFDNFYLFLKSEFPHTFRKAIIDELI